MNGSLRVGTVDRALLPCRNRWESSTIAPAAPLASTAGTNSCPSNRSPFSATKRSPRLTDRESVLIFLMRRLADGEGSPANTLTLITSRSSSTVKSAMNSSLRSALPPGCTLTRNSSTAGWLLEPIRTRRSALSSFPGFDSLHGPCQQSARCRPIEPDAQPFRLPHADPARGDTQRGCDPAVPREHRLPLP